MQDKRRSWLGALAQLGEHLLCKQGVIGSIPIGSTTFRTPEMKTSYSGADLICSRYCRPMSGLLFDIVNGFFNRCRGCIVPISRGMGHVCQSHTFIGVPYGHFKMNIWLR